MSLFTVDREKCAGDGVCAAVCPVGIIKAPAPGGYPELVAGAEKMCIDCGHCLAACPHGALSLESMKGEDAPAINPELLPRPEQVAQFLKARRSVRRYKDKTAPRDLLAALIDIARYAPSGHNSQPVYWLVIQDPEEVRRLAGLVIDWMRLMVKEQPEQAVPMGFGKLVDGWDRGEDPICRSAPHLIVAHGLQQSPIAPAACIIALTYLELAAFAYGLGACWAGYLHWAASSYLPLQQALGLPEGHQCCGAMMIGYPQYRYHRIPARKAPPVTWR